LSGLPDNGPGEEYFILVDIPGLDTNNTYHKVITVSNNNYTNLDFVVDSVQINPVSNVSVHDLSAIENQIKVFPNPATNKVTIQYNLVSNSNVTIELYDIFGKAVRTIQPQTVQSMDKHSYSVPVDDLASGMYFVKLRINNAESVIKLFITN
jgi:pectinesterase